MAATLPYKVECKRANLGAYYVVIAAFDCQPAAEGYAGECALANMTFSYRVKRGRTLVREFSPEKS